MNADKCHSSPTGQSFAHPIQGKLFAGSIKRRWANYAKSLSQVAFCDSRNTQIPKVVPLGLMVRNQQITCVEQFFPDRPLIQQKVK